MQILQRTNKALRLKNLANVILKRKERVKYNSFKACFEELIQLSADHIVKQHNRFWLKEKPSENYNTHYMTGRFQFLCNFFNQGLWDVFFSSKINKHILPRYAW